MKYKHLVNRLIAADDLHYDNDERRFVALSQKEVKAIIGRCAENGITDPDQIKKVVRWATAVRVSQLLHSSFMSSRLRISGFSDDEPLFSPLDEAP
jgi:hypothetical protein